MKVHLTKVQFNHYLLRLMDKLNGQMDQFDMVLGIKNGGLHVSGPISDFYEKIHQNIHISFYNGEKKMDVPIISTDDLPKILRLKEKNDGKFLWVDDIVDSGSTLQWFINYTGLEMGKDFSVASIHWCKECSPNLRPEYFVDIKQKDNWIVYPWEV